MLENASNQELLAKWKSGDERSAQVLVQRYMVRLTALARSRMSRKLSRRLDPEDIVMSAWRSFFVATNGGRLAVPPNDDIWPFLVTLTLRKLARQASRNTSLRRNLNIEENLEFIEDWQEAVSRDPSPEEAAMITDQVERLMASLNESDRDMLTRRLQGEDQAAIAVAMGCSERTVRRSIARIRETMLAESGKRNSSRKIDDELDPLTLRQPAPTRVQQKIKQSELTTPEPTINYDEMTLQKLIGEGGFGKVYQATRTSTNELVAVKFLRKEFWKDEQATRRLIKEAATVASLAHTHIVRHHGWGRTVHGATFLVMDWIEGVDCHRWIDKSKPTFEDIVQCGLSVAKALMATHAVGVVHGDLTPGNVLRHIDGDFSLTDFGFSESLNELNPSLKRGGTIGFMAPEQLTDAFGPIGIRTDVYGLGGLLYALITRSPPISGRDIPETTANVLSSLGPVPLNNLAPDSPQGLTQLVMRCLSKEIQERPAGISEVLDCLESLTSTD